MAPKQTPEKPPPKTPNEAQTWAMITRNHGGTLRMFDRTFRSFDDIFQWLNETASPAQQEQLLHNLLGLLAGFRQQASREIVRFGDLFESLHAVGRFNHHFQDPSEYQIRWKDLLGQVATVRGEEKKIKPILAGVLTRVGTQEFYDRHLVRWGGTRMLLDALREWLTKPNEDLTEKFRLITNNTFSRCLHPPYGGKGGTSDSTIPQPMDIRGCIEGELKLDMVTEAMVEDLKKQGRIKKKPQWSHAWVDPATGIFYDTRPEHPIPPNLPRTCSTLRALGSVDPPPSTPESHISRGTASEAPSNVADSQPVSKKRRISQTQVKALTQAAEQAEQLLQTPRPTQPPNIANLDAAVPLRNPTKTEQAVWTFMCRHAVETVKASGTPPQKVPSPPAIVDADIEDLTNAINRITTGITKLPPEQKNQGLALYAQGLCRGYKLAHAAEEAHWLSQMYNLVAAWSRDFPNNPQTGQQANVSIRQGGAPDNNYPMNLRGMEELIRDATHDGFIGSDVVAAGIAARLPPQDGVIIDRDVFHVYRHSELAIEHLPEIDPNRRPRYVFFIIGRGGNHFALGWASLAGLQYGILDSMAAATDAAEHVRDLRVMESIMEGNPAIFGSIQNLKRWVRNTSHGPQQEHADCGIFAIRNAWTLITSGAVGRASTAHILQQRYEIMQEIDARARHYNRRSLLSRGPATQARGSPTPRSRAGGSQSLGGSQFGGSQFGGSQSGGSQSGGSRSGGPQTPGSGRRLQTPTILATIEDDIVMGEEAASRNRSPSNLFIAESPTVSPSQRASSTEPINTSQQQRVSLISFRCSRCHGFPFKLEHYMQSQDLADLSL